MQNHYDQMIVVDQYKDSHGHHENHYDSNFLWYKNLRLLRENFLQIFDLVVDWVPIANDKHKAKLRWSSHCITKGIFSDEDS